MLAHFQPISTQHQKSKEPISPLDHFMSFKTVYQNVSVQYEKLIFASASFYKLQCKLFGLLLSNNNLLSTGSDLPDDIAGYWIFTDDMNFNTGYPKAILESVNETDFLYLTNVSNVPSKVRTLTGNWAPIWNQEDKGEIRVGNI